MKAEDLYLLNEIKNKYGKIAKDYRQNKRMPLEDDSIKIKELVICTEDGEFSLFEDEIDVESVKKMVNKRADKWEREEKKFKDLLEGIKVKFPEGFDINEMLNDRF